MRWRVPIPEAERSSCAAFVIAFALTIMAWASLHDLYLISVAPRHFTAYHRPLLPLSDHRLLALQYATVATLGPGMVFGALAFVASRLGPRTPLNLGYAWRWFLPVVALVETCTLIVGAWARKLHASGAPLPYPAELYPDHTAGIAYSQSVNITAYLAAVGFGGLYLVALWLFRKKKSPTDFVGL
ncbi:MAG TPA: hypothetical protein VIM44_05590 [Rariglobus sp.]